MTDDLDDILGDGKADLEARFQELEREAEIEELRQQSGAPPRAKPAPPDEASASRPKDDPLADMKAALDGEGELERYLLVLCQGCGAKNRMSLTRVRTATAICGRCKQDLSFTKF